MTATILFVRHAVHDGIAKILAGRTTGIKLGQAGLDQAQLLGLRLAKAQANDIFTSPRERAQETAAAIVNACGARDAVLADALDEVDFGSWSGRTFEDLNSEPDWRRWNEMRSLCRSPGGESVLDVQQRAVSFIQGLAGRGDRTLILVSHGDVIKSVVTYYLGLPIDAWPRFEISPASITTLALGEFGAKLLRLNEAVP
jgi:broad specificity phosphatase PhoE